MTDEPEKFSDKHQGPSFTVFDEETQAHISKSYKHLKGYFWDGDLPEIDPAAAVAAHTPQSANLTGSR